MVINKKPLISILIPAYNQPTYTRECLESIFIQTGFTSDELEVIMVDDCSPDDLSDIGIEFANKYPNFHFERANKNRWMAGNWNYLLELKKWEYFIFLSNDDAFSSEKSLRTIYDALLKNDVDVCYGRYLCINENREFSEFIPHNKIKEENIFLDTYASQLKTHSISFGWILYKDFWFTYDVRAGMWADWEYNLQYLWNTKKVLLINSFTLLYRIHMNQGSSGMNYKNYIAASFYIIWKQFNISSIQRIRLYCHHIMAMCFLITVKSISALREAQFLVTLRKLYNKLYA
jgi:glycosyltransferase involved in cell wall biosynthesis